MIYFNVYLNLIFCVALATIGLSGKIPLEIPKCKFGDTECIEKSTGLVLKNYSGGIPSMNLVSIDPIEVDNIDIINGDQSPVNIQLKYFNPKLYGIKDAVIKRIIGFPEESNGSKNRLEAFIPRLVLLSSYKMNGQFLFLPIQGSGASNTTLLNVNCTIEFTGKSVEKNGKNYMQTDNLKLKLDPSLVIMNFENLFNGDKVLAPTTNEFLNDNWRDIFKDLQNSMETAFGEIIQSIINRVYASIPYKNTFEN